jgi:hypothetical protein
MKKTMMLLAMITFTATLMFAITVDGYVTDAITGDPIDGANVKFVPAEGTGGGGCGGNGGNGGNGGGGGNGGCTSITVTTDVNGYYLITDLEAGVYDGIANKPGSYPSVRIEDVELTDDTTINFELEPGGCIIPPNVFESRRSFSSK